MHLLKTQLLVAWFPTAYTGFYLKRLLCNLILYVVYGPAAAGTLFCIMEQIMYSLRVEKKLIAKAKEGGLGFRSMTNLSLWIHDKTGEFIELSKEMFK